MDKPRSPELVMLNAPASPRAEAFRVLRARLDRAMPKGSSGTVLVTSPTEAENRHAVAANLALALAETGTTVVLADLDLHAPRLHDLLDLHDGPGVLQCLESGTPAETCLQPGPLPSLSVIGAGGGAEVPARLLGSPAMSRLLAELGSGRAVVLAGPPALPAADASLLSGMVDGVILVTTAYRTRRSAVRDALARLEGTGANLIGAVLDGFSGP
ncbi:MAG: CpsD/CapB family tyrosine-protein kinase [Anaerolineae bacterium]|nr:CpsD/CapB family tyrosine-protein kinase [Anaerolineae bacterium]